MWNFRIRARGEKRDRGEEEDTFLGGLFKVPVKVLEVEDGDGEGFKGDIGLGGDKFYLNLIQTSKNEKGKKLQNDKVNNVALTFENQQECIQSLTNENF